jgi:hypothetical protein
VVLSAHRFIDISDFNKGFQDNIAWMWKYGITKGADGNHYAPRAAVTRGQMASFLYRLAGSPNFASTSCGFVDVVGNYAPIARDICWLKSSGVTKGVDPTHFVPQASVTRGQMASFLYRLAGSPNFSSTDCGFVDVIDKYAPIARDVCWLKSTGITTGVDPAHFAPGAPLLRVQMAAFISRAYEWAMKQNVKNAGNIGKVK